jgi:integrase
MGRATSKLSVKFIERKDLKPGRLYGDGGGLYLQVSDRRTKAWVFRFMIRGVARKMGLGDIASVTLAEARKKAHAAHLLVIDGHDPIAERDARKAALAVEKTKAVTFREAAESYIRSHAAGWRNVKHAKQWGSTLEAFAYPLIGGLPVSAIDTGLVLRVLEPIWQSRPETASRLRGRIEAVLAWATVRQLRTGPNPATWRNHLDKLLPKRSRVAAIQHHPALSYKELPAFMAELRKLDSIPAHALEFAILTTARSGNVFTARWGEIDVAAKTWNIPAEKMKGRRAHTIPLSPRALTILRELPRQDGSDFVFCGALDGKGLSHGSMSEALRALRDDVTVHGMRSTFKDWASEQTSYANELSEMALAHAISGAVERAYRRGTMLERRAQLMADWASYCGGEVGGDNVISLRSGAHHG